MPRTPSAALTISSIGRVTAFSMSSGATPSYWVTIETMGKSMTGMRSSPSRK